MRKILLLLAAAMTIGHAKADEGMWTMYDLDSAINKHSTVEHDYMRNGFYAKSYAEELPNENMFVSFMKEQKDITARVESLIQGKSMAEQESIIDSLTNVLTDSVKQKDKTLHVTIDAFYEGNKYYATTYQDFRDLRLVFTVPKSMGKYGGETDNWMWPRQTCDFSVFRIYADPETNGPAEYSENNVPYHPQGHPCRSRATRKTISP